MGKKSGTSWLTLVKRAFSRKRNEYEHEEEEKVTILYTVICLCTFLAKFSSLMSKSVFAYICAEKGEKKMAFPEA